MSIDQPKGKSLIAGLTKIFLTFLLYSLVPYILFGLYMYWWKIDLETIGIILAACFLFSLIAFVLMELHMRRPGSKEKVGQILFNRKNYKAALPLLEVAAANGSIASSKLLGDIFFHGLDREKDWNRATAYYEKVLAMDNAVYMFIALAVQKPEAEGLRFGSATDAFMPDCLANLEQIAASGNAEACLALGHWYGESPEGRGDVARAVTFYRQALNLGCEEVTTVLGWALVRNKDASPEDTEEGLGLLLDQHRRGEAEAGLSLAKAYLKGAPHLKPDWDKGVVFLEDLLNRMAADIEGAGDWQLIADEIVQLYDEFERKGELKEEWRQALARFGSKDSDTE